MIMTEFDYIKPSTLEEASDVLLHNKNSRILAGGTDLFVKIRNKQIKPDVLVDIKGIDGLDQIHWNEGSLFIGVNVTWTQIKENQDIAAHYPALIQAASVFGCYEVRNRATLGGNIANAAPGCEGGGPCLIYDASVKIYGPDGYRTIPLNKFFTGPGRTVLKEGEILTQIIFPAVSPAAKSIYKRASRTKGQDLASCAITFYADKLEESAAGEVRLAMAAAAPTPARFPELENLLSYKIIDGETLELAKVWMKRNLYPRASSLRGTPRYKKIILGNLLEEILLELKLLKV